MKPNLNVLVEYRKRETEFLDRAKDLESVTRDRDTAKQEYDDLRKTRLEEFMVGFSTISSKLKEMYQVSGRVEAGLSRNLELTISDCLLDDHPWRQCRAGTGR
jgi:chromosome segregation ATPase